MTTTTLNDVRPAGSALQETALRPSACESTVATELVATWSAEARPTATWSVQARPTLALQRRLIAGLVG
jgi:hypothetical protein